MPQTSFILSAMSLVIFSAVGCVTAASSTDESEPRAQATGYGYEFTADPVEAAAPPAHRAPAAMKSGRLPPEIIQNVVRQGFPRMTACYDTALAKDSKLTGQLTLRFVIGQDGKVTQVGKTTERITDPELATCVGNTVASLEFPTSADGIITVVYPLTFGR